MKKLLTVLAIALFTVGLQAQDTKPVKKEKAKKESCCKKQIAKTKSVVLKNN
ncbi:hypothetical protein IRZ71_21435 [Flavobacterium sp. ANB]|uniref:hypothetical protein n=1 Tax=unclassified Flavobacterium TaxID=196869 RepID=UPI0012B71615|nr:MULTISPECIES: hypothetical protein [unclassified Flavobacterium]MBF4518928.1 hypothetical protein [Flavobacterium sp. ANB]MTD71359.1 hypothetical protein [Flavobacterium sp. LC2016-13]